MRGIHSNGWCGSLSCKSWLTSRIFMPGSCGLYANMSFINKEIEHSSLLLFFFFACLFYLKKKKVTPEWCLYKSCFSFFLFFSYFNLTEILLLLITHMSSFYFCFYIISSFYFVFVPSASSQLTISIKSNLIHWTTFPNSNLVFQ